MDEMDYDDSNDQILFLGEAAVGKSTLVAKYDPDYLLIDSDQRGSDQRWRGKISYIRSNKILIIKKEADELLGSLQGKVKTIAVDSVTSIVEGDIAHGQLRSAAGEKFNKDQVINLNKTLSMRVLRDIGLTYRANVLYVAHLEKNAVQGKAGTHQTITPWEVERMKKALSAVIEVGVEPKRKIRYCKIAWCRYNMTKFKTVKEKDGTERVVPMSVADDQVLYDVYSQWEGMPERLHSFMREFKGTEGYTGSVHSLNWLKKKALDKYQVTLTDEQIKGLGALPLWFNTNAWTTLVDKLKPEGWVEPAAPVVVNSKPSATKPAPAKQLFDKPLVTAQPPVAAPKPTAQPPKLADAAKTLGGEIVK